MGWPLVGKQPASSSAAMSAIASSSSSPTPSSPSSRTRSYSPPCSSLRLRIPIISATSFLPSPSRQTISRPASDKTPVTWAGLILTGARPVSDAGPGRRRRGTAARSPGAGPVGDNDLPVSRHRTYYL
eukprot:758251-Hanusia_phi.AAC.3